MPRTFTWYKIKSNQVVNATKLYFQKNSCNAIGKVVLQAFTYEKKNVPKLNWYHNRLVAKKGSSKYFKGTFLVFSGFIFSRKISIPVGDLSIFLLK